MKFSKIHNNFLLATFVGFSFWSGVACSSHAESVSEQIQRLGDETNGTEVRTHAAKELTKNLKDAAARSAYIEQLDKVVLIAPDEIRGEPEHYYPLVELLGLCPDALEWQVDAYLDESIPSRIVLWERVLHKQMMCGYDPSPFIISTLHNFGQPVRRRTELFLSRVKVEPIRQTEESLEMLKNGIKKKVLVLAGKITPYGEVPPASDVTSSASRAPVSGAKGKASEKQPVSAHDLILKPAVKPSRAFEPWPWLAGAAALFWVALKMFKRRT